MDLLLANILSHINAVCFGTRDVSVLSKKCFSVVSVELRGLGLCTNYQLHVKLRAFYGVDHS